MIWMPAKGKEVRDALLKASLWPAGLLEVDSGTVVVIVGGEAILEVVKWADACQRVGGVAVLFAWDARGNSYVVKVSGVPALTLAARLAHVFDVAEDKLQPSMGTDSDNVPGLFEMAGDRRAAQAARLVGTGAFDGFVGRWKGRRKSVAFIVLAFALFIVVGIVSVVNTLPIGVLVLPLLLVGVSFRLVRSRPVLNTPINQVLPILTLDRLQGNREDA
jgi:hypothetical protein